MALALRLLSAVAVLSLAFGEADDDNTHAILQRLADASQSLMPVGDITVAEYNELRHGQETMSKELDALEAAVRKKKMQVKVHVLPAAPGVKVPGPRGPPGKRGKPGKVGPAGDVGAPGALGPRGPAGKPGKKGQAGDPGTNGVDGGQGPPGRVGKTGANGKDGKPGKPGKPGKDGGVGAAGPEGPQGYPGAPGKPGKLGAQGKAGKDGPQGAPGRDGAPGKAGPNGPPGKPGAEGKVGDAGPPGQPGAQGPDGPQGPIGKSGKEGQPGPDGYPGRRGERGLDKIDLKNETKTKNVEQVKYNYVVKWQDKVVDAPQPAPFAAGIDSASAGSPGVPYGRAINAADGHHVGGVQLIFTAQRGGMSRSIFTSSTGSFSIELPAGDYSVKAQKTGFSESVQSVKVEAGKMVKVPIVLSEIIDTRMARFIMTWGTTPKNLDVYLKTPSGCIVSYQSKKCYAGEDVEAQLDFDETEGYGPETITIKNPQNGKYQYWVQQFSKDGSLLDSKATLLLIADGKISKYQLGDQGIVTGLGSDARWEVLSLQMPGFKIANM